jgi:hypothetical protein
MHIRLCTRRTTPGMTYLCVHVREVGCTAMTYTHGHTQD